MLWKGVQKHFKNTKNAFKTKLVLTIMHRHTSKSGDTQISLKEHVDRLTEGQNDIFYITGETIAASTPGRAQVGPRSGPGRARAGPIMLIKLTKLTK